MNDTPDPDRIDLSRLLQQAKPLVPHCILTAEAMGSGKPTRSGDLCASRKASRALP